MFLTDKLAKKIMADPKVQFQMIMGLIDNLTANLGSATKDIIDKKMPLDEYESKLYSLSLAVQSAFNDVLYELERSAANE